jgi:hypothetical protein
MKTVPDREAPCGAAARRHEAPMDVTYAKERFLMSARVRQPGRGVPQPGAADDHLYLCLSYGFSARHSFAPGPSAFLHRHVVTARQCHNHQAPDGGCPGPGVARDDVTPRRCRSPGTSSSTPSRPRPRRACPEHRRARAAPTGGLRRSDPDHRRPMGTARRGRAALPERFAADAGARHPRRSRRGAEDSRTPGRPGLAAASRPAP